MSADGQRSTSIWSGPPKAERKASAGAPAAKGAPAKGEAAKKATAAKNAPKLARLGVRPRNTISLAPANKVRA